MDIDILKADGACDGYEGGHDTDHWDLLMTSDIRHEAPGHLVLFRVSAPVSWHHTGTKFMRIVRDNTMV